MDQFTEVSQRGFLSRIFRSFFGILIGLLCLPGSVLLIGWNEYRTVHRARGLLEAEGVVVNVNDPAQIDKQKDNRLIHVTGLATTQETLSDSEFSVQANALMLRREVEMYQWVEHTEKKTRNKMGGGQETVTTYSYDCAWRSGREASESFEHRDGHSNPQLRYRGETHVAKQATLGAYQLGSDQVDEIQEWKSIPIDEKRMLASVADANKPQFKLSEGWLYSSVATPDPNKPVVGDQRIRFESVEPTTISMLAKQHDTKLENFQTSNGEGIESLMVGTVSATDMFNSLKQQNTVLAMILRIVGWVIACAGFGMIAGPLKTLADVVPFVGQMVGTATFLIAVILGSCLTLVAISVAWIAVRPIYSISLLALVGVGLFFLLRRRKPVQEIPMATLA